MIPRADIAEWREHAPWRNNAQVEQDLILSRAITELFCDATLSRQLAFRGGTALHKLFLAPAARYSEDIDLVQVDPMPIGPTIDRIREILEPWMGEPVRKFRDRNTTLIFRCDSEIPPIVRLRLKVEINCREHLCFDGRRVVPYNVSSRWFQGECAVPTFSLDELLATKMRALYQRRKGRDLFDLWYALDCATVETNRVAEMFQAYMSHQGHVLNSSTYIENVDAKLLRRDFLDDTNALLRDEVAYKPNVAWPFVRDALISQISDPSGRVPTDG